MNAKQRSLLYIFTEKLLRSGWCFWPDNEKILTKGCKNFLEVHLLNSLFAAFTTADERNGGVLYPYVYFIYIMKMNVLM